MQLQFANRNFVLQLIKYLFLLTYAYKRLWSVAVCCLCERQTNLFYLFIYYSLLLW